MYSRVGRLRLLFIEKMCIQVHVAALELEPNTYRDGNPFQFEISDTWTSKGQIIHSYDAIVSDEDGHPKCFYDITDLINYGYRVVDERSRYQGI